MPRVKRGVTARASHKKVLNQAKGFAGRGKNVYDVLQCLPYLADEVVGLELALGVPADLPADEHETPACRDAVGIADRLGPALRLEDGVHAGPPGI